VEALLHGIAVFGEGMGIEWDASPKSPSSVVYAAVNIAGE
jgi:hypothetical protein